MTAPRTPVEPLPEPKQHAPMYPDESREDQYAAGRYVSGWNDCHAAFTRALATPLAVQATDEREAFERAMGLATPKRREEWFALPRVQEAWRIWRAARAQLAQAPAALSDEQKRLMYRAAAVSRSIHPDDYHRGILDAERAHGIGISHKEKDE